MSLFCRLYLFTPVSFLLSSTMENRSKARLVGSGELVLVLSESVRSHTCPSIHFVKTFSHLFFKRLLLYFYVLVLHYLSIGNTAWLVGSYFPNQWCNPHLLQWKYGVLTTRKSLLYTLFVLSLTTGSGDWGSTLTTAAQFSVSFLHFLLVGLIPQPSYLEHSSLKHLLRK